MSPFVIYVIVITVGYCFYFGITISHDIYGKKNNDNKDEEFFVLPEYEKDERSVHIDEDTPYFNIFNDSKDDTKGKYNDSTFDKNETPDAINQSNVTDKILQIKEKLNETEIHCTEVMDSSELRKAILSDFISRSNNISIEKRIITDKV